MQTQIYIITIIKQEYVINVRYVVKKLYARLAISNIMQ